MNKHKHFLTFVLGMLTAVLLCTCVTTALAASGAVTFNTVNVAFNGMKFAEKDETFQLDSGATIPSTILYTDEKGGSTTYMPIRKFADTFQIPVDWDESSDKVTVRVDGELGLYTLPLYATEWSMDNCIKEVEPIIPKGGTEALAQVDHHSMEAFTADVPLIKGNGQYVSVTVTNHGNKPVGYSFGRRNDDIGSVTTVQTQIPAGETVTRTIEITASEGRAYDPLYVFVGYSSYSYITRPVSITVSAIQFKG